MAILSDNNERRVIPEWNALINSPDECRVLKSLSLEQNDITKNVKAWTENPSISYAGDLISAAIVGNNIDLPEVKDAALYVIQNEEVVPSPLLKTSKIILSQFELDPEQLTTIENISKLKQWLIKYPSDAIAHIEIARQYLVLGQIEKAELHIESALFFDCNNRYVVRCACRFYVHKNQVDRAIQIIRKSSLAKTDPWVMASEISLCQILGKSSRLLKSGIELIESHSLKPLDISELSSAIATEEYLHGSMKKCKRFFTISLLYPNSNSLAQAQWFISKEKIVLGVNIPQDNSFDESLSLASLYNHRYEDALKFAQHWIKMFPFSTRAISLGDTIATSFLRDYKSSEIILRDAIKTHHNNAWLSNNLAYALALDGRIDEAEVEINRINKRYFRPSVATDVCILATKGLIELRKKNLESGKHLYFEAIQLASDLQDAHLLCSALLNYSRELLIAENSRENVEIVNNILLRVPQLDEMSPLYSILVDVKSLLESTSKKSN